MNTEIMIATGTVIVIVIVTGTAMIGASAATAMTAMTGAIMIAMIAGAMDTMGETTGAGVIGAGSAGTTGAIAIGTTTGTNPQTKLTLEREKAE